MKVIYIYIFKWCDLDVVKLHLYFRRSVCIWWVHWRKIQSTSIFCFNVSTLIMRHRVVSPDKESAYMYTVCL
jgi:hypothetical protein